MATKAIPPRPLRAGGEFTLENITRQGRKLPNRVILHAKGGWGKTSFAAQVPGVIFLMVAEETGLWTLMEAGQINRDIAHFPTPAWEKHDLEFVLAELATKDHGHKALAIDSVTMVEKLLQEKICTEKYNGDWDKFNDFGGDKAYKTCAAEWDTLLAGLDRLQAKGMGVMLLCHSDVVKFKNPDGPDYDRWASGNNKHSWTKLFNWADMVLFGDFETFVDKQNKAKSDAETKGKARGGDTRVIKTQWRATHDAKNRHGLPEEIECGESPAAAWAAFLAALKEGRG